MRRDIVPFVVSTVFMLTGGLNLACGQKSGSSSDADNTSITEKESKTSNTTTGALSSKCPDGQAGIPDGAYMLVGEVCATRFKTDGTMVTPAFNFVQDKLIKHTLTISGSSWVEYVEDDDCSVTVSRKISKNTDTCFVRTKEISYVYSSPKCSLSAVGPGGALAELKEGSPFTPSSTDTSEDKTAYKVASNQGVWILEDNMGTPSDLTSLACGASDNRMFQLTPKP